MDLRGFVSRVKVFVKQIKHLPIIASNLTRGSEIHFLRLREEADNLQHL
jgi:hypothetical protein